MGEVASIIPTREDVDAAWERHAALAGAVIENPRLILDRSHMERATAAEREFRRKFLAFCQAGGGARG